MVGKSPEKCKGMIEKVTLQQALVGDNIRTSIVNLIGYVTDSKSGLMPTTGYISRSPINVGSGSEEELSAALDELLLPGYYILATSNTWQALFIFSSGSATHSAGCIAQLRITVNGLYYRVANSNTDSWSNWVKV